MATPRSSSAKSYRPSDKSRDFLNLYAADAALIDTGATRTSVSVDIIHQLDVSPIRQEKTEIGNTLHDVNVYNVKIMLSSELTGRRT